MEFFCQALLDVMAYKNGYGEKYLSSVTEEVDKLRSEISRRIQTANGIDKENLEKLLYILDHDPDIKAKKGV